MFLQNILIKENNNYTKRILHSHTDHYPNMATNWKKLTTKQLNRSIACNRSKQRKKKNHVLVCKTHHSTVLGSITFPTDNFQSNLTCFHKVDKKDFATVLDACCRSVVLHHIYTAAPQYECVDETSSYLTL